MLNPIVSDPNDFKVVDFTNKTDFTFTPEMGCMFDGRPIFGITGAPGINAGESMKLPYHVGQRLAVNLAKVAMTRQAPAVDQAGIPTGVPLWDTDKLMVLKNSYLTDLYTEQKPIAQTEVEKLMAKVEELNRVVQSLAGNAAAPTQVVAEPVVILPVEPVTPAPVDVPLADLSVVTDIGGNTAPDALELPKIYQDKKEVIDELDRRKIKHDRRKSKEFLEKLLNA